MKNLAIYVHWPFCKSKCPYCDFNSHVREKIDESTWHKAYLDQIDSFYNDIHGKKISSIFFGGGTPSLMNPKLVEDIISKLANIGTFAEDIEITLEANPTSIEIDKFRAFKQAGVNRISIGVQSLDPESLKFLGRTHSENQAIKAIEIASDIFDNFSIDLIYARPGQSIKAWESELIKALSLAQKHISLYQLTIEKGTSFYSDYKNKKFIMPNEILSASMYNLTTEIAKDHGFEFYEISNYAKKGFESKHNLSYWNYDNYLGIGAGAHSRINNEAIMMIHNPEKWLEKVQCTNKNTINYAIQSRISLTKTEIFEEFVLMGLRTKYGINKVRFAKLLGADIDHYIDANKLAALKKEGLIKETKTKIAATTKGTMVLNKIIEFLTSNTISHN